MKENCISIINSCAKVSGKLFKNYLQEVMPVMFEILNSHFKIEYF